MESLSKKNIVLFVVLPIFVILLLSFTVAEKQGYKFGEGSSNTHLSGKFYSVTNNCPDAFFIGSTSGEQKSFLDHPPGCTSVSGITYTFNWKYSSWGPAITSCGQIQTRTASCIQSGTDGSVTTVPSNEAASKCGALASTSRTSQCKWVQTGTTCSWHANPYHCDTPIGNICTSLGSTTFCNYFWSHWCGGGLSTLEKDAKCELSGYSSCTPNCIAAIASTPCGGRVVSCGFYCGVGTKGCRAHKTPNTNPTSIPTTTNFNTGGTGGGCQIGCNLPLPSDPSTYCTSNCQLSSNMNQVTNSLNNVQFQTTDLEAGTAPLQDPPVNLGLAQ